MANGRLGKGTVNANTETVMATVSNTCSYATIQVLVVNRSTTETAKIQIAITEGGATTTTSDIIDSACELPPGGVYMNNVLILSAGEQVKILSDKGDLSYRIAGIEK